MATMNADNIWVLSALDKLMINYKNNPAVFAVLFEKKQLIIGLIQSSKITSTKYKALLSKAYKQQSGDIKKCAQNDLMKLKDANNQKMLQTWWRQMIEQTGAYYNQQQKMYKGMKKVQASNKQESPAIQQTKKQKPISESNNVNMGLNLEQIVSFKSLDNLLDEQSKNKENYARLLQRKQKLLGLVKSKTMTADKYKVTLETYIKKIKNEDLISDYKFQLQGINDFHDGNINSWFLQIIEQTSEKLDDQKKQLSNTFKNVNKKESEHRQSRQSIKQKTQTQKPGNSEYNINEIACFKVFQDQLQILTSNKQRYHEVLMKKKQFLNLCTNGGLNAQKYKALLIKSIKQVKNQQIRDSMQFQLSELTDFHSGNLQEWFKDIISNAELFLEDQQNTLDQLQKGIKIQLKTGEDDDFKIDNEDDDDEDLVLDGQDFKIVKKEPKQSKQGKQITKNAVEAPKNKGSKSKQNKHGIIIDQIVNLKVLDEYMNEFTKDAEMFCLFLERKQQIFSLMKEGKITPSKYKQLQEQAMKTSQNQKMKEAIEMDLFDLKDMCNNNVNQWFQNLVNQSGDNYQDQQVVYNKLKGSKAITNQQQGQTKETAGRQVQKFAKPNINQLICITGVIELFSYTVQKLDILYYKELIAKRQKLIDLIAQNRLNCVKYRQLNKATANKTQNTFLKKVISEEQKRLVTQFHQKEDLWFSNLTSMLNKPPPELKMPENEEMKKINKLSKSKKIEYLVKRVAQYQSLLRYFQKYEVDYSKNAHILQYRKQNKKEILKSIELIRSNNDFDVYNFVQQLLPVINPTIFYGQTIPYHKKKADIAIEILNKQIAALKAYASKLKKSTNAQNLLSCEKEISKCSQNISYLKSWPGSRLAAFPILKEEKIQKLNLDVHKHLDKNQVQIIIKSVDGLSEEMMFKAFVIDYTNERFFVKLKPKKQNNFKFIVKLSQKDMNEIYKGQNKPILFRVYEIGFFGGLDLKAENRIQPLFRVNNTQDESLQLGNLRIGCCLKVQRPSKPLITQIVHLNMKIANDFRVDPQLQREIIGTYCTQK